MSRFLKISAGLLLLLLAALVLALLLVDPNEFKDEIQDSVFRATGRELTIEGDLSLTLFPRLGLEVSGASVANPPDFGNEPLAELGRVQMRAPLLPLLAGRLEVERVHIEGLRLNLIRDPQGRANWDAPPRPAPAARAAVEPLSALERTPAFIRVSTEEPVQAPAASALPAPAPPPARDGKGTLITFGSIAGVDLVDARVSWDDRQIGWSLVLDGLEASTGPIRPGEPVELHLSSGLTDAYGRFDGRLAGETTVAAGASADGFVLAPLKLRVESLRTTDGLEAWGELSGRLAGSPHARRYQVDGLGVRFDLAGAALAGARLNGDLSARLDLDLRAETLVIDGLSLRAGALAATGDARGWGLLANPVYEGDLALAEFDLRAWLQQQGRPVPRTMDPETLRLASLTFQWRADRDRIDLTQLALSLDQSLIQGALTVMRDGSPVYRFDLTADTLDLDRYLPAGAIRTSASERVTPALVAMVQPPAVWPQARANKALLKAAYQPAPATAPRAERDLTPPSPRHLSLEGRLSITELKAAGLAFGATQMTIRFENGVLGLENQVESFYQGRLTGSLGLDLRESDPGFTLVQQGAGIALGPLLRDLAGETRLTGRGDITADLDASGRDESAIRRSLAGNLAVHVREGAVQGFNLERMVREAEARLRGKQPPTDVPNRTDFSDLRATGQIEGGVLSNQDLTAASDYVRVTGRGSIDLANERFDYRFEPVFVDPPRGRGIKELENIPIPVLLTGTFDQPKWEVDVAGALRGIAKRKLDEQGGDLLRKLEERTGIKGLGQSIRDLLGR